MQAVETSSHQSDEEASVKLPRDVMWLKDFLMQLLATILGGVILSLPAQWLGVIDHHRTLLIAGWVVVALVGIATSIYIIIRISRAVNPIKSSQRGRETELIAEFARGNRTAEQRRTHTKNESMRPETSKINDQWRQYENSCRPSDDVADAAGIGVEVSADSDPPQSASTFATPREDG